MSLFGVGVDIVEIARIEASLSKLGLAFAERVLHRDELAKMQALRHPARYLAKRFAAKEAFAKALGTGIAQGVSWQHIRVDNDSAGKPAISLEDNTLKVASQLGAGRIFLSLSDEKNYAVAQVIIERAD